MGIEAASRSTPFSESPYSYAPMAWEAARLALASFALYFAVTRLGFFDAPGGGGLTSALVIALAAVSVFAARRVDEIRKLAGRHRLAMRRIGKADVFYNSVLDSISDPICIVDPDYNIFNVNEAFASARSMQIEDLIGRKCYEAIKEREFTCEDCGVASTIKSGEPTVSRRMLTDHKGRERMLDIYTYPLFDPDGRISHVIEYERDVTDSQRHESENLMILRKLEFISQRDFLTGLLNRRSLAEKLDYEFSRSDRYGTALCLMVVDVDRLSQINDDHGHDAGDRALTEVSEALVRTARRTDIVGRHSSDEFLIILPLTTHEGAEDLARRLIASMEGRAVKLSESNRINITLSIGISGFSKDTKTAEALLARAEAAMRTSKKEGRNRHTVL